MSGSECEEAKYCATVLRTKGRSLARRAHAIASHRRVMAHQVTQKVRQDFLGGEMKRVFLRWGEMARIAMAGFGLLLCLLAVAGIASAQVRNSTLRGTVTDQNGAVIPNASITVA